MVPAAWPYFLQSYHSDFCTDSVQIQIPYLICFLETASSLFFYF